MITSFRKRAFIVASALVSISSTLYGQSNKCVVNGKILYTDGECPSTLKGGPPAKPIPAQREPALPEVERGLWVSRNTAAGSRGLEMCGSPIARIFGEVQAAERQGCSKQITSPVAGTFLVSVNCSAETLGKPETTVTDARMRLKIVVNSPRSITVEKTMGDGLRATGEMTRIGECK